MRIPKRAGWDIVPTHAFATEEAWNSHRVTYLPAGIAVDYRVTNAMLKRLARQGVIVYLTSRSYPQGTFRGELRKGALVWVECPPFNPHLRPHDAA